MSWVRFSSSWQAAALAIGLAAALLGLQAGLLVWTLAGHPGDDTLHVSGSPGGLVADPGEGLAVFAASDPFGVYIPPANASAQLAETGLGLSLHGVVMAAPASRSRAFIMKDGAVSAYRTGDTIIAGVRLDEVHARFVVLDVEGVLGTLSLPELDTARPSAARSGAGVSNVLAQLSPSARATASSSTVPAANAVPAGGTQAVIETYRRRIEANPQAVLDSLNLEATGAGYRIGAEPPEAVRRAGLQPGDVVTRVNGRAVGDVESDRRLYDLVAAQGRASIEVRRGERTITLTFPLQ